MEKLLRGYVYLLYAFVYLPVAVVVVFSLNDSEIIAFPLTRFTTEWYRFVLADGRLLGGLGTTFAVAIPVAILTTTLGGLSALALTRYTSKFRIVLGLLVILPFFVPRMILAVSQVTFLQEIAFNKSLLTVCIGQSLVILPFTTIIIASVLYGLDPALEEAASDLGANSWKRFRYVQLPLMKFGLMAAFFIAFVLSTAEYTVSFFTSGRAQPLSILVASDFRFHLSPTLYALASLIVLFNIIVVVISELFRRRGATKNA